MLKADVVESVEQSPTILMNHYKIVGLMSTGDMRHQLASAVRTVVGADFAQALF